MLQVSILIETDDLSKASPTFVSHNYVTTFNHQILGWHAVWHAWLAPRQGVHAAAPWLVDHGTRWVKHVGLQSF